MSDRYFPIAAQNIVILLPLSFVCFAAAMTQYVQEDAFIYFRTASNITFRGDYSFNPGENYPAVTSTLYAFLIAGLIKLFGGFFVLALHSINFGAAVLGAWLLASTLPRGEGVARVFSPFVFWFVAASPPLVLLATSGMETGLLFLALSALVFGLSYRVGPLIAFASVLMPLLRVEATIAPIIVCVLAGLRVEWRIMWWTIAGVVAGLLVFLVVNLSLTGEILPQTIMAKNVAYNPSRSMTAILDRVSVYLFEGSFFLGIYSKYIPTALYVLIGVAAVSLCTVVAWRYIAALRRGHNRILEELTPPFLVTGFVFAFPLGYIYGGVIFPWYLWPSSVFFYYLTARLIETATVGRSILMAVTGAILTALSLGNLALMTNYGAQEGQYRTQVGHFIAAHAEKDDTLFLEPAGYIPFYAGLKTWDTVGLVNPDVLAYRRPGNHRWWIEFVREKRPTWIVERQPLHQIGTPDGTQVEGFSEEDRQAFHSEYELVRNFVYSEFIVANRGVLTPIYELGDHSDYFVYRRR